VRDATTGAGVPLARVWVDDGRQGVLTDTAGAYRLREIRSGRHTVRVEVIGYRPARRDSVPVRAGETTVLDFTLQPTALVVDSGVVVEAPVADPVLDPLVTADIQSITAEEIRRLPVTTLEEAVALGAGTVGEAIAAAGRPGL
jgi:hypothetical protein